MKPVETLVRLRRSRLLWRDITLGCRINLAA